MINNSLFVVTLIREKISLLGVCVCECSMIDSTHLSRPPTANEYGLFRPDEDPTKGRWLEQGRTLEYYHLKDGVSET